MDEEVSEMVRQWKGVMRVFFTRMAEMRDGDELVLRVKRRGKRGDVEIQLRRIDEEKVVAVEE